MDKLERNMKILNVLILLLMYMPKSEIGSYQRSIFNILRKLCIVSTVGEPIYILTNRTQDFPSLYILTNICYLLSFRYVT